MLREAGRNECDSPRLEGVISCRDVRYGFLPLPLCDGWHVHGAHGLGGHGARLSRERRLRGAWPLPCDDERRARDARRLFCDGLLLVLTWVPPVNG